MTKSIYKVSEYKMSKIMMVRYARFSSIVQELRSYGEPMLECNIEDILPKSDHDVWVLWSEIAEDYAFKVYTMYAPHIETAFLTFRHDDKTYIMSPIKVALDAWYSNMNSTYHVLETKLQLSKTSKQWLDYFNKKLAENQAFTIKTSFGDLDKLNYLEAFHYTSNKYVVDKLTSELEKINLMDSIPRIPVLKRFKKTENE